MNKKVLLYIFPVVFSFAFVKTAAQNVGVNSTGTTPNSSAILDLNTGNTFSGTNGKGLIIPNVTLSSTSDATTIGNGNVTSLLVYNTTASGAGSTAVLANTYYYWNGVKWVALVGSNGWLTTGNYGTTAAANWMGSNDANDVVFKSNGTEVFRMGNSKTNLMVNSTSNTTDFLSSTASNTMNGIGAYVTGTNAKPGIYALSSSTSAAGNAVYAEASAAGPAAIYAKISNASSSAAAIEADGSGSQTANAIYAHTTGSPNYSSIYCYANPTGAGTGFTTSTSNHTLLANMDGNLAYSFGLYGRIIGSGTPSGGVMGYWGANIWGTLGYKTTGASTYGGYFNGSGGTGNTSTGTGRLAYSGNEAIIAQSIGMGAIGDLMGGWAKGNVYGMLVKGDRISLYVDGKTIVNKPIMQVTRTKEKTFVNYTPASVTADLQTHGTIQLVKGEASVDIDKNLLNQFASIEDLTIIVTPRGQTNGVYAEIINGKLVIKENSGGASNVKVSWIVIGKRNIDSDFVPEEIQSPEFENNLNELMHNENDSTQTAPGIWWDGKKLNKGIMPQQLK